MSKKRKKRHPQSAPSARTRSQGAMLADEQKQYSKRFKPAARNLLFLDLIFLAVCQLLYSNQLISPMISGVCTLIGVILLFVALWIQFGNGPSGDSTPRPPRLR